MPWPSGVPAPRPLRCSSGARPEHAGRDADPIRLDPQRADRLTGLRIEARDGRRREPVRCRLRSAPRARPRRRVRRAPPHRGSRRPARIASRRSGSRGCRARDSRSRARSGASPVGPAQPRRARLEPARIAVQMLRVGRRRVHRAPGPLDVGSEGRLGESGEAELLSRQPASISGGGRQQSASFTTVEPPTQAPA